MGLSNLATVYRTQGRYEQADRCWLKALEIQANAIGTDRPEFAQTLNNLATFYKLQGQYEEAEALYLRSIPHDRYCMRCNVTLNWQSRYI